MKKYTPSEIHKLLCKRLKVKSADPRNQALFCPYYVPLKGVLGADWGVIVNPTSRNFGTLVFEHDGCGCADHQQVTGTQTGKDWMRSSSANRPASTTCPTS